MSLPDSPLALIGLPAAAARALRALGLIAVSVPAQPLPEVLAACARLHFSGVVLAPELGAQGYAHCTPDSAARRQGQVDALSFGAETHGTCTLEDALIRVVEASGYPVRGSRALLLGEGPGLGVAAALARLGLSELTVAASSAVEAGHMLADLPAGTRGHALSLHDEALPALAERADLLVLVSGVWPAGALQPYHTLLDLRPHPTGPEGHSPISQSATDHSAIDTSDLTARRLALQLEHATGQRFTVEALQPVAEALQPG